jgi:orotidine-5'-phosphate decarboxylase
MTSRLIVALDFNNQKEAMTLVEKLEPDMCALKVGSEMFTLYGPNFVRLLADKGFRVFLDLKYHDIPSTVARACKAAADLGVWMLNVHAVGGREMMHAAREALVSHGSSRPLLIAVTVLTSMSAEQLQAISKELSLEQYVCELARLACDSGLDGVVSSALDVPRIKEVCGNECLAITPGIRMSDATSDDQSRITTPQSAIEAGSDYLVVGRPITRAAQPADKVREFLSYCSI